MRMPMRRRSWRRRRRSGLALGGQRDHRRGDARDRPHGGFRLRAHVFPCAGFRGIDIDREEHLAVGDRDRRQHVGVGQGDAARRRHLREAIKNLLLRYAHYTSPEAASALVAKRALLSCFDAVSLCANATCCGSGPQADLQNRPRQSDATHRAVTAQKATSLRCRPCARRERPRSAPWRPRSSIRS